MRTETKVSDLEHFTQTKVCRMFINQSVTYFLRKKLQQRCLLAQKSKSLSANHATSFKEFEITLGKLPHSFRHGCLHPKVKGLHKMTCETPSY